MFAVMENAFSLLGVMYFPFFLVVWVVWQVSIAFIDVAGQDRYALLVSLLRSFPSKKLTMTYLIASIAMRL